MFHSPRSIINCSRQRVVSQIQWRNLDPTVNPFLGNLSGITLTYFHFLYKASRELVFILLYQSSSSLVISSAPTHKSLQITKLPKPFLRKSFKNNRDKHTHSRKFLFLYILPFILGHPPRPSFFCFRNFFLRHFRSFKWVDSSIW